MAQRRGARQRPPEPIPIPALARDMLGDIGDIGFGLGRQQPSAFAKNGAKARAH